MFLKLLSVLQHSFLPLVWREAVVNFSLLIHKATLNNGRDKYIYASVSTHLFKIFVRMIDSLNVIPREKSYIPSDSDNICLSLCYSMWLINNIFKGLLSIHRTQTKQKA